jgi:chromosome segregation ATPase
MTMEQMIQGDIGEQSIKSLRGKKGEDLIFNGGA